MKTLKNLLKQVEHTCILGTEDMEVTDICFDSRKAVPGSVFVCIRGTLWDGNRFIRQAKEAGCTAVVTDEIPDAALEEEIKSWHRKGESFTVCRVGNAREALAEMSGAYFGYPAKEIPIIGITGTKGKTSAVYMIQSIFETAGILCGLMGTIETIIGEKHLPSENTTLESYYIQKYLREMVNAGCRVCVMEVSSQGLMMHRVDGIHFNTAIFTNISPDHIGAGEHKDFKEYLGWKSELFRRCDTAVVNADDARTEELLEKSTCPRIYYGMQENADYQAVNVSLERKENKFFVSYDLQIPEGRMARVAVGMPGQFQVYNSLAAIAAAMQWRLPMTAILKGLQKVQVKGRMELVYADRDFMVLIDYAHNAVSLKNLLLTLKEYQPGRLVCLFGCGGNRSRLRRYEMGETAGRLADYSIVTSDNPRFEDPYAIIDDIRIGMGKTAGNYIEIADRRKAIEYAIRNHKAGDVLVLAGKGHEMTQEINGKFYPMDEREIAADVFCRIKKEKDG